jgi:hypothetical protein
MVSASIATALVTPLTPAMTEPLRTMVGCTRCSMPASVRCATPSKLHAVTEFVGGIEIGERDRFDAFHMHRVGVHFGAESQAGEDRELVGGVKTADVEGGVGFGIAEALRVLQATAKPAAPHACG